MNQDSREQFEQAYSEDNGGVPLAQLVAERMGDSYRNLSLARAWYWWKRARAGVVVVLPVEFGKDRMVGKPERYARLGAIEECKKAIEVAGVKVVM